MGAPQAMQRRPEEKVDHHRAFLLYAMQAPDKRSQRAVSRALGCSGTAVRKWMAKHGWDDRLNDPEHVKHAAELYAAEYHRIHGGKEVWVIEENLGVPYPEPREEEKSQVARSVDLYEKVEKDAEISRYMRESGDRSRRLKTVLDVTLAQLGKQLVAGDIKVKPSDLGTVIRGHQLIEEAERRRISMLPSADQESEAGSGENVATSQRVMQAQSDGGDVLRALEEDAEELLLVLRTMRTHEQESNVVRFPSRGKAAQGE